MASRKTTLLLLLSLLLAGCKSGENTTQTKTYLGFPKSNSITLRVKPSFILDNRFILGIMGEKKLPIPHNKKTEKSSANVNKSGETQSFLGELSKFIGTNPNTENLLINHYKDLIPDLSKNWVAGSDVVGNGGYAFIYLSFSGKDFLGAYLENKKIAVTQYENFSYAFLDETPQSQSVIAYDSTHLILIGHQGAKDGLKEILSSITYESKSSFLKHYKKMFSGTQASVDIHFAPSHALTSTFNKPLIKDILKSSNFKASISLDDNRFQLKVKPTEKPFILDTLFNYTTFNNTGIASLGIALNLDNVEAFLNTYDLMGSVEHELKKAKTTYKELKSISDGTIDIGYNGRIKTRQKSITYDYDDDFNEVEKVTYTYTSSHDLNGTVGLKSGNASVNKLVSKKWILRKGKGTYEFLAGVKNTISADNNMLKIGKREQAERLEGKLILALNDPQKLASALSIKPLKDYNFIDSATLLLNKENELSISLELNENFGEFVKSLKSLTSLN